jgi:hypothetical protein
MPPITYGLYEQVINRIIHENLSKIKDDLVEKNIDTMDSAESSKILAEYFARILYEVLNYIGDGENDVKDRIDLCNSIIMHIADCIDKGNFGLKTV